MSAHAYPGEHMITYVKPRPGDFALIHFRPTEAERSTKIPIIGASTIGEVMWVLVTTTDDEHVYGRLASEPIALYMHVDSPVRAKVGQVEKVKRSGLLKRFFYWLLQAISPTWARGEGTNRRDA